MSIGSSPGERRGGRRPGTPNKATLKQQVSGLLSSNGYIEQEVIEDDRYFDGSALQLAQRIYKDRWLPWSLRMDAMKAAIKYETPALQAVSISGDKDKPIYILGDVDARQAITDKLQHVLTTLGAMCAMRIVATTPAPACIDVPTSTVSQGEGSADDIVS